LAEFEILASVTCPCNNLNLQPLPLISHRQGVDLTCDAIAEDKLCHAEASSFISGLMAPNDLRMDDLCCDTCRSQAVCLDEPVCQNLMNAGLIEGNCRNVVLPNEYPGMQLLAICPVQCDICLGAGHADFLQSCAPPGSPVIRLGGLFPIDEVAVGSWSTTGIELESAFLYSCARINADCQMLSGVQLECVSRDTSFDENVAIDNAQELMSMGLDGVIGAVSSSISMAVASNVFGPQEMTQISPSSSASTLSDTATYPYFFRTCASDVNQVQALRQLVQELGFNHVATIATTDAYASALADDFEADMVDIGVPVVASERFAANASPEEVVDQVMALKNAGAKTILISAVGHDALTVLGDMLTRDMVGPQYVIIGTDGSTGITQSMVEAHPNGAALYAALDGMIGIRPKAASGAQWEEFVRAWHAVGADRFGASNIHNAELGDMEVGVYAAETADAVYAYAHAFEGMINAGMDIGSTNTGPTASLTWRRRTPEFLDNVDFEGATGRVQFTAKGDRMPNYEIIDWQGGESGGFVNIGEWSSEGLTLTTELSFITGGDCEFELGRIEELELTLQTRYTRDQYDAAIMAAAVDADISATAMLDITFLKVNDSDDGETDRSGHGHQVTFSGAAAVEADGAHFGSEGDDISISNFEYARDGTFTVSFWFTKEVCTDGAYEYLYSHHANAAPNTWSKSYVDVYLACEGTGGTSTVEGSIIRYWLRDVAGQEAAMDFSLHDAGLFDAITNVWVHQLLSVTPTSLLTYDDGILVADSEYGYFSNLDGNIADPAPSALSTAFAGSPGQPIFDLQTNILLGGRVATNSQWNSGTGIDGRHFHGRLALLRIYSGAVGSQEAECIFREGDAALAMQVAIQADSSSSAALERIAELEAIIQTMYTTEEYNAANNGLASVDVCGMANPSPCGEQQSCAIDRKRGTPIWCVPSDHSVTTHVFTFSATSLLKRFLPQHGYLRTGITPRRVGCRGARCRH
jgi:ABC-type branched-subunit amino acid transport system substrate-binding protein